MSSAALRSRTGRADGGGADDDASGPAPILDTDAQEALVNELEADARRQATVWRRVFGALSIAWGIYFVNSAAHAASGDVTIAWSGVRTAVASPSTSFATPIRLFATTFHPPIHPRPPSSVFVPALSLTTTPPRRPKSQAIHAEFYHHDPPTMSTASLTLLDLCAASAAIGAGVAAIAPARGARARLDAGDDDCLASIPGWTRRAKTAAFAVSTALGFAACVGWAWTIARTRELKLTSGAARVDFDAFRMTWLPVACVAAPGVCWHVYQSLERGTVVEAARLRRYMYNHKRA